jgi:hypothetical protein
VRDAVGIGGDEHRAAEQAHPDADDIDAIEDDPLLRVPRQVVVKDREQRGDADGQPGKDQRRFLRQRCRRNRDRRQEQQREWVLETAGQRQQPPELQAIIGQLDGRNRGVGAGGGAEADEEPEVEGYRQRDQ